MLTSDHPTSSGRTFSSAPTQANSRRAWLVNACADLADSTHGTATGSLPWAAPTGSTAGASSRITCALVPLIPNDDTPARRGRPGTCHGRGSVNNDTAPADQSTCGVGTSTCNVLGSTPWRIACTILITPATPAAADV
ncbi:Uncharacterised protein [Mycobacterium tuberculosis]|uniref:Uncharacterized protein n=1 Tax=Mycobacterium tuberculosis TaxID=1773 RepID=A0A655AP59_MYCTX|nr:Uncharacterised protein [Mycobacterium tuberculosis]CKN03550.1 Uncharacterised protein [Mycobacterium tuberculosis]CKS23920.1 Uncharacterised protein [Mycobacterium tuberculosis]CKS62417.1 Uncharacterised protein [Mycobacterium tuberculosis]CKT46815.1 Uncharacterised protein [Mycobacterium tuberculosis]